MKHHYTLTYVLESTETRPGDLDDTALARHVQALCALAERVEVARLAAVGELQARGLWAADGAANPAAWLAGRTPLSPQAAAGIARTAHHLRSMPATSAGLAAGTVTTAQARILAGARTARSRAAFDGDEASLVGEVAGLSVEQTAAVLRRWAATIEGEGPDPAHDRSLNTASASRRPDGRMRVLADLDAESGAIFASAFDGTVEELRHARRHEPRPASLAEQSARSARLRADALVELARRAGAAGDRPGPRPLLWVVTPEPGTGLGELPGAGPLPAVAVERLACDATVAPITVDRLGRIVDVGRTARTATPTQRRLLALRDRGCRFKGCDRPPPWCEAHHIVWWERGGRTDLDNLVLLCSYHHHLCHEGGWRIARQSDGALRFLPPSAASVAA
jgi:hypothetical protein